MVSLRSRSLPASALTAAILLASLGAAFAQGGGQSGGQGAGQGGGGGSAPAESAPATPEKPAAPSSGGSGGVQDSTRKDAGPADKERPAEQLTAAVRKQERKFDDWLASSTEGARLERVRGQLRKLASAALGAGVPLEAFTARIREAVAKGASPETVVSAIQTDSVRWIWLAGLVDDSWPPARNEAEFYLAVAAALRNGLGDDAVREIVAWARATRASAGKAGAALTGAAAVSSAFGVQETGHGSCARTLATSKLRVGEYDAVAALAARAAVAGIDYGRFLAAMEATIGRGLPLSELEGTLFR